MAPFPWWLLPFSLALAVVLAYLVAASRALRRAELREAWRHMALGVPFVVYAARWRRFDARKRRIRVTCPALPDMRREEALLLPDNSRHYEDYEYRYHGLAETKALLAGGSPVALVAWHHGAIGHHAYGVARVLRETAFFSRATHQFGRVLSYSILRAGGLTLFKMKRFLEERRPVHYFVDGPATGETVGLPVLWETCEFSVAPVRTLRSVAGVRLVPVTAHYGNGGGGGDDDRDTVTVTFHPPLPPERLMGSSERDVLADLLALFEADLRANAPEQVELDLPWLMRPPAGFNRPRRGVVS